MRFSNMYAKLNVTLLNIIIVYLIFFEPSTVVKYFKFLTYANHFFVSRIRIVFRLLTLHRFTPFYITEI